MTIYNYASSGGYITFTPLSPNTYYSLSVNIYSDSNGDILASLSSGATTSASSRPSNWSWTTAELNAFNNHGNVTTLTYLRWNAFCACVDDFRSYKGLPALSSSAYMTSSDKTLTASRFNAVRLAIDSMSSTGITNRATGDIVYGSYFLTLSSSLNSIQ